MCRQSSRGFTLLELIVVIALVIVLFATALENLLPLRGAAERAAVLSTVGNLRSAVGLEASLRAVRGGKDALLDMENGNPIDWLAVVPNTYAGEFDRVDDVPAGSWAWLPSRQVLFYRVRYPEYVESDHVPAGIRYRVVVERGSNGQPRAIVLKQLDAAEWDLSGSELKRWLEEMSS